MTNKNQEVPEEIDCDEAVWLIFALMDKFIKEEELDILSEHCLWCHRCSTTIAWSVIAQLRESQEN